jgi:P4 family phage/plasmid primase-like protien
MSFKNGLPVFGFLDYISRFKTMKSSAFTHTSMLGPMGAFYIPVADEESFLEHYNTALKQGRSMHFTEKHRDISPILIDLDFRFPNNTSFSDRQYTLDHIHRLLEVYLGEISKYVSVDEYDVYVMEKKAPRVEEAKDVIKDGIHIVIPNVVTKLSFQHMIRNDVISKLKFMEKELKCSNTIDDIIDKAVIDKNNWMMYGSSKPNGEPYLITHHLLYKCDAKNGLVYKEIPKNEGEGCWNYTEILSIRNKFDETPILESKKEFTDGIENEYQDIQNKQIVIHKSQQSKKNKHVQQSDNFELAEKLIDILDKSRADKYDTWISVGWCARNIDNRLITKWIEFSQKSSKFGSDDECHKIWAYMKESGLGIGTLCMWAKQDNLEKYSAIVSQSLYSCLLNSASKTDYDIALVIYNKFKQDFVCSSIKQRSWFEYKSHRWTRCEEGFVLKKKMSTDMNKEYLRIGADFANRAAITEDPDEEERCKNKNKIFNEIATKLKDTIFKDKMLKESALHFFNEQFADDLLDANPNLIGFENGVYDLQNMEFREGHPEDYISFSTKINYVEYNPDDPYVDEIMDFMKKVLPKDDIREYVLTLMASMLDGNNKEEKFYIWTGHGSNGKSKCIELLEKSMGDYACTFNISLLTNKRVGSSQTNSELVRAKGRRFAVLQEPEEGEKMNAGFMKELSGNDKIITRGLYKESVEFKPMFQMVLTCNHLPSVPPEDGGTWRRIRLVEFSSHFCDKPNPDNPNEFQIDRDLAFKFEDWKESFMSILIMYFKKYKQFGISEPDEVLQCTKNYQRTNDTLGEFMDICVQKKEDSKLELNAIYEEYKEWHKLESISGKVLRKKPLKEYLDKHLSKSESMKNNNFAWPGYTLVTMVNPGSAFMKDDDEL